MTSDHKNIPGLFAALEKLIDLSAPIDELMATYRAALRDVRQGNASGVTTLHVRDLQKALHLYLEGHLSAKQLSDWASLLEANELVEYAERPLIADILFRLATPEINDPITPKFCLELLSLIEHNRA